MVIEKLQAGAKKAQEVARKLEAPPPSAEGVEALVSAHLHPLPVDVACPLSHSTGAGVTRVGRLHPLPVDVA